MESEPPKLVDLLEEDKPLSGQKFVCISFVSPENILKQKSLYFFEKFLKNWSFEKSMNKYSQFTNFIAYKYNINADDIQNDLKDFVKEESNKLIDNTIEDEYKSFLDKNEQQLENDFSNEHHFKTNTRGIKVRGVFETQQEAELRCKILREVDPNHDVYVGPVGLWMPWEPEAYKTGRVEYLEDELNQLMHEKDKNEKKAKQQFDARVKNAKEMAIENNKKLAVENNNKLTQNIDEKGNLYSVNNEQNSEVPLLDVRKELFDKENVILSKKHQDKEDKEDKEEENAADKPPTPPDESTM
jgi:hypothetical protein